jgi:hypothetical protein
MQFGLVDLSYPVVKILVRSGILEKNMKNEDHLFVDTMLCFPNIEYDLCIFMPRIVYKLKL